MKKNLGSMDRAARSLVMLALGASVVLAPVGAALRIALAGAAIYLLFTVLAGTCLGYRLLGLSSCPAERRG